MTARMIRLYVAAGFVLATVLATGCSESAELEGVRAEAPAFHAAVERVLAHQPDLDAPDRPCPDGELLDRVKGEQRDMVLVYVHDLRVALGKPVESDGPHATVSGALSHSALKGLEPLPAKPIDYDIRRWREAIDLLGRRPWLAVFWPKLAANGSIDVDRKTFDSAFVSGLIAVHDPISGEPICWSRFAAGNSDTIRADHHGQSSNMASDFGGNLKKAVPTTLTMLSAVLRVPELSDESAKPVEMTPEQQIGALHLQMRSTLFDPVLKHLRDLDPIKAACDDTAMAAGVRGREKSLLLIDHRHLYIMLNKDQPLSRTWIASPELATLTSEEGGPQGMKQRLSAIRRHRYLGVFKTLEYGQDVPPVGHLVIFDIDTAKQVCVTDQFGVDGNNDDAKKASFRAHAAERLAEVSSILTL